MEIKKSELSVEVDDLDVRGNGCLTDCTKYIYPASYKSVWYTLNGTNHYYPLSVRSLCGTPNAYQTILY